MTANPRTNNWVALSPSFPNAKCAQLAKQGINPDPIFNPSTRSEVMRNMKQAKELCFSCEHRIECLEWALENREPEGIWGGLTVTARNAMRRKLKMAAKPRKLKGEKEIALKEQGVTTAMIAERMGTTPQAIDARIRRFKMKAASKEKTA